MPESALPPPAQEPETNRGVLAELLSFAGSLGRHLQALLSLAGLEGREAAGHYLRLLVVLGAAVFFALFGYLLLMLFAIFGLAWLLGVSWIWIALGLAVLHGLAALGGVFYARARLRQPVFSATSAELRKDFEALQRFKP